MDKIHATIHKASRSVVLDPHTKAGFRRTLEAMTAAPELEASRARLPRALAWALAAVVIASTGATATYASTHALPGEALYGVKVKVLEPAETALAFSAEAKADVAVAHLERRFQEAAVLSASGKLDDHDEELAVMAEKDIAAVDRDDQPVARARFQALASVYRPNLKFRDEKRSRFALAVRLADAAELVADDIAQAKAEQQLSIALAKGEEARKGTDSAVVALRLKNAARLAEAARLDLDRGSYQTALRLSGAAAAAATEAQVFSSIGSTTTTSTTVTNTTSTTTTTIQTPTTTATTSLDTRPRTKPRQPAVNGSSGVGSVLHNLLNN